MQIHHLDLEKPLGTYSMMDICRQATFAKEEIIEVLGITGAKTRVIVKTLNGKNLQVTTEVRNLKVAG